MKGQELNIEIERQLTEFETLHSSELNQDWQSALMKKIDSNENVSRSNSFQSIVLTLAIIVLAINAIVMLKTFTSQKGSQLSHTQDLRTIEEEFLINENLSNN